MCSTIYENLEKRFSCLKDWILYITFMKTYAKAFDCVDHNKLWEILKEMGIPDHLTCLLRNLYAGQEATVRTGHGTTDWFQTGKGVCQSCILSPCLFNLYAEYLMRNVGLEEAQAGMKFAGRNINNLRYADALHAARKLCGQATAGESNQLLFSYLWQSSHCCSPWQFRIRGRRETLVSLAFCRGP